MYTMSNRQINTINNKNDLLLEDFNYNYNIDITRDLDDIDGDFTQDIINKIVLWKVNRYPRITEDIIRKLNNIKNDTEIKEKHKRLLSDLLGCTGVQLPIASTFMRFRNPSLFQIIDQRVYRLLNGHELSLPLYNSEKNRQVICTAYFEYLRNLRDKCKDLSIPFEQADRILYNADKRLNKDVKLKNYGG